MATCVLNILTTTGGMVTPASGAKEIGTPINLTAIPLVGYDFVNWILTDGATFTTPVISVTPINDAIYTAYFTLHNLTITDYTNLQNFFNRYYVAVGVIDGGSNALIAGRMLPYVIAVQNELAMFNFAKSLNLDTSVHYANIVNAINLWV